MATITKPSMQGNKSKTDRIKSGAASAIGSIFPKKPSKTQRAKNFFKKFGIPALVIGGSGVVAYMRGKISAPTSSAKKNADKTSGGSSKRRSTSPKKTS